MSIRGYAIGTVPKLAASFFISPTMASIQVPIYILDSTLRHLERIVSQCRRGPWDTKTSEAFRLALQDIKKLRKLKDTQK